MGIFQGILDPVMRPLLAVPPVLAILIISIVIAVITTLVYKFFTDQTMMKALKEDMNKFRKKMKQFKDEPDKMMKIQKQSMEKQMQYMMHSFKPMFITFLPIILIFGWLNANLAFEPINPGEQFEVAAHVQEGIENVTLTVQPGGIVFQSNATQTVTDGKTAWNLTGSAGEYTLTYNAGDETAEQQLIITHEQRYAEPEVNPDADAFRELTIDNEKLVLFRVFGLNITWLWGYIIFIMILSTGLRKLLKVH